MLYVKEAILLAGSSCPSLSLEARLKCYSPQPNQIFTYVRAGQQFCINSVHLCQVSQGNLHYRVLFLAEFCCLSIVRLWEILFSLSSPPQLLDPSALSKCLMGKMVMHLGLLWISSVTPTCAAIKRFLAFPAPQQCSSVYVKPVLSSYPIQHISPEKKIVNNLSSHKKIFSIFLVLQLE